MVKRFKSDISLLLAHRRSSLGMVNLLIVTCVEIFVVTIHEMINENPKITYQKLYIQQR